MKNAFTLALIIFFLNDSITTSAQFSISAEVRPRTEFRDGFKTPTNPDNEAAFFTEQRSRLNFNFSDTTLSFSLSLQDIRIWGESTQIIKQEDGNTFLNEAWAKYSFSESWAIKFGRQMISYDNQRFLGGLEWAQQGRRHDALLIMYQGTNNTRLDIGLAFNSDDDVPEPLNIQSPNASFYSVGGNYKSMQYAWYHNELESFKFSLLAHNAEYQTANESTSFRQTLGFYAKTKMDDFNIGTDFYYQMGKTGEADVSAYFAGINLTYLTLATPITIGVEIASGKSDDDLSTDIKHFRPDFGTNHAHYGYMDYFFVGASNGTVGVVDIFLKTKFKIKRSTIAVHGHQFLTGSKQIDFSGNELSKTMGTEVDLVYGIQVNPAVKFNLGYSFLLASDTMEALRGGDANFNSWAWLMFTAKPTLFTSK